MDDSSNMFHLIDVMVQVHVQIKYFLKVNQLFHILFQFQFFVQKIYEQYDIENDDPFQLDELFLHIKLFNK
jgi:hypothetical protein